MRGLRARLRLLRVGGVLVVALGMNRECRRLRVALVPAAALRGPQATAPICLLGRRNHSYFLLLGDALRRPATGAADYIEGLPLVNAGARSPEGDLQEDARTKELL